jgi:predicted transcriptional regulator of viral defense system
MEAHDAQYYLGGLMAFNRHGLSTQIANQFTVYNNKVSALKKFGKFTVKFIKVASKRICDFDSFPIPGEQQNVNIANLARTILDAIHDWKTYQILSQAYGWLKKYSADRKFLSDFIRLTAQTANCNTKRRVGFYLEKLGVNNSLLLPILKKLNPTAGWIALNPSSNQTGKTIKKWGIIDNVKYPQ